MSAFKEAALVIALWSMYGGIIGEVRGDLAMVKLCTVTLLVSLMTFIALVK